MFNPSPVLNRELGIRRNHPFFLPYPGPRMREEAEEAGTISMEQRHCAFHHNRPAVKRLLGYELCQEDLDNPVFMTQLRAKWEREKLLRKEIKEIQRKAQQEKARYNTAIAAARARLELSKETAPSPEVPTNRRARLLARKGL
jgi:hypothetical protein